MDVNLGLLILRIVVGSLLAGHGAQKLFGWFGGYGLKGVSGWMASMGLRPASAWALLAGLGEFLGGLGLATGFLAPLSAAVVVGVMLVAASTHLSKGVWASQGGYELPITNLVIGAFIGMNGAGAYSLDYLFGISLPDSIYAIAQIVVLLGVIPSLVQMQQGAKAKAQTQKT
ncbi:DoxX family protein [Candidatus Acetothermia bacterium]|nr:DoxX family protein [Candidatus Acetothermia bacterium]MBI3643095.1 DoxX family protein [Candidatus Acetothermia bacterium]